MPTNTADERLAYIDTLYKNENLERQWMDDALKDMGVIVPEEKQSPFERVYFTGDMLAKYEPCIDSLQILIASDGEDDDAWNTFETTFNKFLDFSWVSQWDGKRYDIVFYGVSGYTGYLFMEYLKRVATKKTPEQFTFAFAGRTASKVAAQRDREMKDTPWADTPVIAANYDDPVTMYDMAKSGRVVVNVAGPYMLTPGEIMLDACCYAGTHYVDVNGEIPWFFRTMSLDKRARASNTLICPSAAPAGGLPDAMVYMNHKVIKEQYGKEEELSSAVCYVHGGGVGAGTSGGTLGSRDAMTSQGDAGRKLMADPFALTGFVPARDRNGLKEVTIKGGTGATVQKIRKVDTDATLSKISEDTVNQVLRVPQTYAFFDTRVVRRTNALLADHCNAPYGRNFSFSQFGMIPNGPSAPVFPVSEAEKAAHAKKVAAEATVTSGGPTPSAAAEKEALIAQGKYYKAGEGPPLEDLGDCWTAWMVAVESVNGHTSKNVFSGNDGYFETARCATETALSVVYDYDKLPIKGGCVTLGAIGGEQVTKRIINSGIKFKQGDWNIDYGPIPM